METVIPHIGIVIVSYNSAQELSNCIKSAQASLKSGGFSGQVVVVDNNSSDDSGAVARKAGAHVIANETNQGFAAAVNKGTLFLLKHNSSHILLLNPDALVRPEAIGILLRKLQDDKSIGATGPAMLDGAGKSATSGYYLKAPSWISILLFSTSLRPHSLKHPWLVGTFYEETNLTQDRPVAQIPGACLLTPKEVLEDIGLLDEDFAIWYEDVEWCYRARKHGYKLLFCKDALVEHEGGVSFAKWQSLDKAVTFHVSMKTFFKKHKPLSYPLVVLIVCSNSILLYIKNRDKSNLEFMKRFVRTKRGALPS